MGAKVSSFSSLPDNSLLLRFVGEDRIGREEDKFWDELLAFKLHTPITKHDGLALKDSLKDLCASLLQNNKVTGNFTTLCCVAIYYVRELITDESRTKVYDICSKCQNALLIIRCCCDYFIENAPDDMVVEQFNTLPTFEGQATILEEFLLVLSEILAYILVDDSTYYMHLEVVSLLLVLLSSQMFEAKPMIYSQTLVHLIKGKCSSNATLVVRRLVHNYIKNDSFPAGDQGIVGWATSGFLSFLGTPSTSNTTGGSGTIFVLNPLASHSLLLLLLLTFQCSKDGNPYGHALFLCKPGKKSQGSEDYEKDKECSFTLNFKRLYSAIARDLQNDHAVLLLYLLLHRNPAFLKYILLQNDLECLVTPILQVLYHAEQKNPHHMYMALIVILIFTQQDNFNKLVHQLPATDIAWYKEKNLIGISLGSLLILIVLRTIQFNMARMRDKYLHTNCLASLANMASNFRFLHTFVTQKLIMLFNHLLKRQSKLTEKLKQDEANQPQEELDDLAILEEIIHMMLEILNACLYNNVKENSNLIYALLRNKELFEAFRTHAKFQDVIENMYSILTFFGNKVEELSSYTDAEEIITLIDTVSDSCPKDDLKKLPQLKFKYLEEEAAEEFFIPYVWSIIQKSSFIHWDSRKIILFNVEPK